jgi:hypothetical protein
MWVSIHVCVDTTLVISLYSYLISNSQKFYVFLIISYVFSSTKLEKRAEQVLPGMRGVGGRSGGRRQVGEMAQTM